MLLTQFHIQNVPSDKKVYYPISQSEFQLQVYNYSSIPNIYSKSINLFSRLIVFRGEFIEYVNLYLFGYRDSPTQDYFPGQLGPGTNQFNLRFSEQEGSMWITSNSLDNIDDRVRYTGLEFEWWSNDNMYRNLRLRVISMEIINITSGVFESYIPNQEIWLNMGQLYIDGLALNHYGLPWPKIKDLMQQVNTSSGPVSNLNIRLRLEIRD